MSARRVARQTFFNFVTIASNALASLVVTALIARGLDPHAMGTYSLVTTCALVAGLLINLGFVTTTMKYMAEALGRGSATEAGAILAFGLRRIGLNAAGVLGLWLLALPLWARLYPQPGLPGLMALAAFGLFPLAVMALYTSACQGLQRYGQVAAATALYAGLMLAGTCLALRAGAGLPGVLAVSALATSATCWLYSIFLARWQPGWWREPLAAERREILGRYSGSLMILIVLDAVVWQRSGVFFLGAFAPAAETAYYAMAFGLATMAMRMIPGTLVGLLIPSMSRSFGSGDLGQVAAIYHLAGRWMAVLALPVAVGGAALAPAIVSVLYGAQYAPVAPLLGVLFAASALVMVFGFPASSVLYAVEGQRFLVRTGVGVALLNLALALWLIPRYGAWGAVWATAVSQLASLVPGAWYAGRALGGVKPAWERFGRTLAAALAMGVPVWAFAQAVPDWAALLIGAPGGAVCYAAALWAFGALEPEDQARVRSLFGRWLARRRAAAPVP